MIETTCCAFRSSGSSVVFNLQLADVNLLEKDKNGLTVCLSRGLSSSRLVGRPAACHTLSHHRESCHLSLLLKSQSQDEAACREQTDRRAFRDLTLWSRSGIASHDWLYGPDVRRPMRMHEPWGMICPCHPCRIIRKTVSKPFLVLQASAASFVLVSMDGPLRLRIPGFRTVVC